MWIISLKKGHESVSDNTDCSALKKKILLLQWCSCTREKFTVNMSNCSQTPAPHPTPPSLAYLCHFLMPEVDLRYWAQHIKARSLFPKLEMKNTLRIQIAVDQMNGWGIFRALSHSVGLDLADVTKAQSVDYSLPAMSLAAVETGTSHSHIKY